VRRLVTTLCLVSCLIPGRATASPPRGSESPSNSALDAPLLPEFAEPASEPELPPVRVGPPPPDGKHMIRSGMFFTVFGAFTLAGGSALLAHMTWSSEEPYGIMGVVPIVFGGGFTTLGALLLHFGQERRWARADWNAGRPRFDHRAAPRPGAGLLLGGTLTLVGSATLFTWGLEEVDLLDVDCHGDYFFCSEGDARLAAAMLASTGAGMLLGTTLIVLGARQRTRYMSWRSDHGYPVRLRPSGWASARGFGVGLQGQF
jgi:hypothetical protein